jgi:hypothetical protein
MSRNSYAKLFAEAFGDESFLQEEQDDPNARPLGEHLVARGDSLLDDGDEAALKSELPGVDDARWTQFVRAMVCADCDAVSESNAVGMFQFMPRRLHDLGLVKNINRSTGPTKRTIYVAVFVPPLTASKFLKNPDEQYRAFSKSCRDYATKISDGEIKKDPGMSLSGALAILHRAGPKGLDTWASGERFPSTVSKFERIEGVF